MVESGSLKEYVVNNIIGLINEMELDGETIQDILEQTGMDEQMYKQLTVKYNLHNYYILNCEICITSKYSRYQNVLLQYI